MMMPSRQYCVFNLKLILAILIAMIMNKQTKIIFAIKKKVLVKSLDLAKPKINVGPTESK
jgi:hypothetical protein